MAKSYSGCSSQTVSIDPDCYLKNYPCTKHAADRGTQTDSCNLDACKIDECFQHECIAAKSESNGGLSSPIKEQEMQRRRNPSRSEDFKVLQSELLQWRRHEERKVIITARNEEERKEMKMTTLKKEAHLLRKIEQLKNSAIDKHTKDKMDKMMEAMSQPRQWHIRQGSVITVDTPETSRARELKLMRDELHKKVEKVETRIKLLESIKAVAETVHQSGLVKDISTQLDRELQMLHRNTDLGPEFMDGMRKRLASQLTKLATKLNSDHSMNSIQQECAIAKFRVRKPIVKP